MFEQAERLHNYESRKHSYVRTATNGIETVAHPIIEYPTLRNTHSNIAEGIKYKNLPHTISSQTAQSSEFSMLASPYPRQGHPHAVPETPRVISYYRPRSLKDLPTPILHRIIYFMHFARIPILPLLLASKKIYYDCIKMLYILNPVELNQVISENGKNFIIKKSSLQTLKLICRNPEVLNSIYEFSVSSIVHARMLGGIVHSLQDNCYKLLKKFRKQIVHGAAWQEKVGDNFLGSPDTHPEKCHPISYFGNKISNTIPVLGKLLNLKIRTNNPACFLNLLVDLPPNLMKLTIVIEFNPDKFHLIQDPRYCRDPSEINKKCRNNRRKSTLKYFTLISKCFGITESYCHTYLANLREDLIHGRTNVPVHHRRRPADMMISEEQMYRDYFEHKYVKKTQNIKKKFNKLFRSKLYFGQFMETLLDKHSENLQVLEVFNIDVSLFFQNKIETSEGFARESSRQILKRDNCLRFPQLKVFTFDNASRIRLGTWIKRFQLANGYGGSRSKSEYYENDANGNEENISQLNERRRESETHPSFFDDSSDIHVEFQEQEKQYGKFVLLDTLANKLYYKDFNVFKMGAEVSELTCWRNSIKVETKYEQIKCQCAANDEKKSRADHVT